MIIKKLRLQRGWSQEQLADLSGLSVRTIQRIEQGQKPGLESLKSLAAVFETSVTQLQQEPEMKQNTHDNAEEKRVLDQVTSIKVFYSHLMTYFMVMVLLFIINYATNPSYIWAWWPAMGWGIGIINHGMRVFEVFNVFGHEWEKRQIEKRLGKKL